MNSQLNNQSDKQEVFKEEQFRPVFFDKSSDGGKQGGNEDDRMRLDGMTKDEETSPTTKQPHAALSALQQGRLSQHHLLTRPVLMVCKKRRAPKFVRKFRSRSLPIINYLKKTQLAAFPKLAHSAVPPLPPINLQSLKEIDLQEILKNPQLRHDILFDPQLQFRPNLDGERGKRKKGIIDQYWAEVEKECAQFFDGTITSQEKIRVSRLPILFTTLRDILLSLLPYKDREYVTEVMDMELMVQQLSHGSFDFVSLSHWLGDMFKSHCAPMRDQWVANMIKKFQQAFDENAVDKLVQGLCMIFQILEAMKLDVANHQIRILRPVLIETAVDFEKDYFRQLISNDKIVIDESLKWYVKLFNKEFDKLQAYMNLEEKTCQDNLRKMMIAAIIDLFSCRTMTTQFPSTLAFDHTRLVLLRADARQLVCVQLCITLYKQLVMNSPQANGYRAEALKPSSIDRVKNEIFAIVRDDNGNIKWTRNVLAIALQLVKNAMANPGTGKHGNLSPAMIDFANNWLVKQFQPSSDVYGLMEEKVFKEIFVEVLSASDSLEHITKPLAPSASSNPPNLSTMSNIASRIATISKFHWNVFGPYYEDSLKESLS